MMEKVNATRIIEAFETRGKDYYKFESFPILSDNLKLKRSDTLVIGGESGYGKTNFALNLTNDILKHNRVLYFNFEMDNATIFHRLMAIDSYHTLNDTELTFEAAEKYLSNKKDFYLENKCDLETIIKKIEWCSNADDMLFVVIDHIGCVEAGFDEETKNVNTATKALRETALNNNIIVIMLSQINRTSQNEAKSILDLSQTCFKSSSNIENFCSQALLVGERKVKKRDSKGKTIVITKDSYKLTKNRTGVKGVVYDFNYDKEKARISEINDLVNEINEIYHLNEESEDDLW